MALRVERRHTGGRRQCPPLWPPPQELHCVPQHWSCVPLGRLPAILPAPRDFPTLCQSGASRASPVLGFCFTFPTVAPLSLRLHRQGPRSQLSPPPEPTVTPFCWKYGARTPTEPQEFSLENFERSPVCERCLPFGTSHCDTCHQPFESVPCPKIHLPEVQVLLKRSPKWRSAVTLAKQGNPKAAARTNVIIKINGKTTREFTDLRSSSGRDRSECPVILALPKPETSSWSVQEQFELTGNTSHPDGHTEMGWQSPLPRRTGDRGGKCPPPACRRGCAWGQKPHRHLRRPAPEQSTLLLSLKA